MFMTQGIGKDVPRAQGTPIGNALYSGYLWVNNPQESLEKQ